MSQGWIQDFCMSCFQYHVHPLGGFAGMPPTPLEKNCSLLANLHVPIYRPDLSDTINRLANRHVCMAI